MDIIFGTLQDAFFAAIASVGFASISNPPHRIYPVCAGIAAVGHSLRYVLMNATGMHLVLASLCAATVIGLLAVFLAPRTKAPAEAVSFPALLPMIPGMYAYRAVFSLIMFMQNIDSPALSGEYMAALQLNATVTVTVIFSLAVGATLPIFLFKERAYSMTREKPRNRK